MSELEIISKEYCVGCGICSVFKNVRIDFDDIGKFRINYDLSTENLYKEILSVCPFSSTVNNEDQISKDLFNNSGLKYDKLIGYYYDNYIGHTNVEDIRKNSSSGGIITWLTLEMLKEGLVDYIISVGSSKKSERLFDYVISDDKETIINTASSKYYPIEMTEVLARIKENDGRYAIVALPCFAKGLRLLQNKYAVFNQRIKFIISPVCGHLKTKNYINFLAWQKGILDKSLKKINFRKKFESGLASHYGTEFTYNVDGKLKKKNFLNREFEMGTNWGHGMFKYPACDYCDDIFGEVSDISVGDAWIKPYLNDNKGNSIISVRNKKLHDLLKTGIDNGELFLEKIKPEIIHESQRGGINNKREDLSYRLFIKSQRNEWFPPKRVKAGKAHLSRKRKIIISKRIQISTLSHQLFNEAYQLNSIQHFYKKISPSLKSYNKLYRTFWGNIKHLIKSFLK